jgi:hypothetical protein
MYFKKMGFIIFFSVITFFAKAQDSSITNKRLAWLQLLDKVARPVLSNLAVDKLKVNMVLDLSPIVDNKSSRTKAAYLEAFARTLSGIAPWLQLDEGDSYEKKLREEYRIFALKSLSNAVNPKSKDFMQWSGGQPLVDASFLALTLVRCPWLWQNSDTTTRQNIINAFLITRNTTPAYTNWLLFSAMIESFFCKYNLPYDKVRIDFAVKEFTNHWYTGDGMFADGNNFHLDYYNSFVIQPYLQSILHIVNTKDSSYKNQVLKLNKIYKRYAIIQERYINSDGSFPVLGRSIAYRSGAFHHLANMALLNFLPNELPPAQVRCALTAVLKKTLEAKNTYSTSGWLQLGLYGTQPNLAEGYINTGSLYLCTQIFLPLGLSPLADFWSKPDVAWTSLKVWNGEDEKLDHALDLN